MEKLIISERSTKIWLEVEKFKLKLTDSRKGSEDESNWTSMF